MLGGQLNTYYTDTTGLYNVQTVQTLDNVDDSCRRDAGRLHGGDHGGDLQRVGRKLANRPSASDRGFWRVHQSWAAFVAMVPRRSQGTQRRLATPARTPARTKSCAAISTSHGIGCGSADGSDRLQWRTPAVGQSRLLAATVYYKVNNWATFAFEQSQYQTTLMDGSSAACTRLRVNRRTSGKISARSSGRSLRSRRCWNEPYGVACRRCTPLRGRRRFWSLELDMRE